MAISTIEDILPFFITFLLLLLPLILILLKHTHSPSPKKPPPPPGPRPWPILGNLPQIGKTAHISLTRFAKTHGPLISLKLGSQPLIVAATPSAAAAVLKTQDRHLSARYIFQMTPNPSLHNDSSLVFSPNCNHRWKTLRSISKSNLFSPKSIESQSNLRALKTNQLVEFLTSKQGSALAIKESVFATVFNTVSNLIFSRDLLGFEFGDLGFNGIRGPFEKMMDLGLRPNLGDFYPALRWFDFQGLRRKAGVYKREVEASWEGIISERRSRLGLDDGSPVVRDFLDVMIHNGFSDEQISYLAIELISAGTDTTTTTIEWAMTELLKNRDILNKARQEIERASKGAATINESQLPNLPYLLRCVQETLRLHPPAPFLLPRVAPQACELMGYTIPKHTLIFVNVYGIGRDPSVWDESESFDPDRFVECDADFKGCDFRFLPFGGGRRICPGIPMAAVQVPLILANLIHCFEWSDPDGGDLSGLSLDGRLGVTLQKEESLKLVPKRRIVCDIHPS